MYRVYNTKEEPPVYPYEERLMPKKTAEIAKEPRIEVAGTSNELFRNGSADDLVLLGLLLVLLYEGCDDWILLLALLALFLFK